MKEKDMFDLNLQIFADEDKVEDKPEELKKENEPVKEEPEPKIDIEAIIAKTTDVLTEKFNQQKEEEIKTITSAFEEKFNAMKEESESYKKLIEGLKDNKETKDILAEIEKHNEEKDKLKKQTELMTAKEKAIEEARKAKEEIEALKKAMKEKEAEDALKTEKAEFRAKLLQEAKDKPYIADKINKILEKEDFEAQKATYLTVLDFFDTDEEKERYELKKSAGSSAFEGVKTSKDGNSDNDLKSFSKKYIDNILKQAEGRRKPKK